jgi:hypothetical protein
MDKRDWIKSWDSSVRLVIRIRAGGQDNRGSLLTGEDI